MKCVECGTTEGTALRNVTRFSMDERPASIKVWRVTCVDCADALIMGWEIA